MASIKDNAGRGRAQASPVMLTVWILMLFGLSTRILVQQCRALEGSSSSSSVAKGQGEIVGREIQEDDFEDFDDEDEDEFYRNFRRGYELKKKQSDEIEDEEEGDGDEEDEDDDEDEDFDGEDFEDDVQDEAGLGNGEDGQENTTFDEKDVVVLGGGNFSEFVKSNRYVLVEFYAPWCGHCQMLAPEYAEAATILKKEAALAKVDATAHDDLARQYSVDSYPTLLFFIDGEHRPFSGHRQKDEIVDWVRKKTGIAVLTLHDVEDAKTLFDAQTSPIVVALLSSFEGPEVDEYASAARREDDVLFFQTDSAEVAEVFNMPNDINRPAVVLLKLEPEKVSWFGGPFERVAIANFVAKQKLPLVIKFSKEASAKIFDSPIKKQVILFAGPSDYEKLYPAFTEASKALMGKLIFVHVDLNDSESQGVTEFFGLGGHEAAVVMGYEAEENGRKFLLKDDITVQSVTAFGNDFSSNKLKPYLKSAPLPEANDEVVKTVVGLNLDDIVLDETKDAFLELYAPWCGHCQALEPTWNKLAHRLATVESIVIAKMDGTVNEHDRAKPDGYPTLLFYPAGKKSFDPITFEGDRTLKEFVKFLKKEAAIPFAVPKRPNTTAARSDVDVEMKSTGSSAQRTVESDERTVGYEDNLSSRKDEL